MTCVSCIVAFILTVLIPLKLSYQSYKTNQNHKQWAIYWAFYSFINGLFWLAPFLSQPPFQFLFVVILVWLYHDSFQGALLIDELLRSVISKNEMVASNINLLAEKAQALKLFENSQPVQKMKSQ